jgi:hypothetical protein
MTDVATTARNLAPPFGVTFFQSYAATRKTFTRCDLRNLANKIRYTTARYKEALPWLKLARFGDRRTPKESLRHDANVIAITGIEADYDAAKMSFDDARDLLEKQGIASLLYTSPSHKEDAPHWRVLCPLPREMPTDARGWFLGRLNGLFGGIFATESWALSQSYYFGSVNRNPLHRVEIVEGQTIDEHDDLDVIAIRKSASSGTSNEAGKDARDDAELVRGIVTGEHLHVELVALAARYIGRNIPRETVVELLRGLMLSHPEQSQDERWRDRYDDIERTVQTAVEKYRGEMAERRRSIAALACDLIRKRYAGADIRATVSERAAENGLTTEDADGIIKWAARQELTRRGAIDA